MSFLIRKVLCPFLASTCSIITTTISYAIGYDDDNDWYILCSPMVGVAYMPPGQSGKQNHWCSRYWGWWWWSGDDMVIWWWWCWFYLHIPVKDDRWAFGGKSVLVRVCTYACHLLTHIESPNIWPLSPDYLSSKQAKVHNSVRMLSGALKSFRSRCKRKRSMIVIDTWQLLTVIDSFMDCDSDPRQTEVEGRNRESSLFHKGNEESAKAGVHMHWNALPTHLLSINLHFLVTVLFTWRPAQRYPVCYQWIHGGTGEPSRRAWRCASWPSCSLSPPSPSSSPRPQARAWILDAIETQCSHLILIPSSSAALSKAAWAVTGTSISPTWRKRNMKRWQEIK